MGTIIPYKKITEEALWLAFVAAMTFSVLDLFTFICGRLPQDRVLVLV